MTQPLTTEHLSSPKLDALCQDLDSFINELTTHKKYDITPLELNKKEETTSTTKEENYTRFSDNVTISLHKSTSSISSLSSTASSTILRQTPPMSPTMKELAPRTSSLNRTASTASGKSNILLPTSPRHNFFSNPTSPLAFEVRTVHETLEEHEFPHVAFLSTMMQYIIESVKNLNEHRRIYCSAEYPFSFSGQEIMDIMRSYLPADLNDSIYLEFTQAYVQSSPPLIKAIDSTENKIRDASTNMYTLIEDVFETEIQGVYTPLTPCYSTSCLPGQPGCYSPSCPNKLETLNGPILKDTKAPSTLSHDTTLSRAWSATVSKEILKSLPGDEIKRQEAIHELIYTEDDYVRDLRILDVDFAQELLGSQCIEEDRKQTVFQSILHNYQELLDLHTALYQDLRDHQAMCQATNAIGAVDRIGHLFLRHVSRFESIYLRYGPHVVLAEYEAKRESERNLLFQQFIKARESLPQCRRLPFRHFILLPVTRLQRYTLLLGAVLKKTTHEEDHAAITQCMETIKRVAEKVDEATSATKARLHILQIDDRIRFKPNEPHHELHLREPGRKLLKEGKLARKSHRNVDTIDIYVFVFDHMMLMTREKKRNGESEYVVSKRPIPMELLQIQEATEGFSIGMRNTTETVVTNNYAGSAPFVVSHLGRHGADYMLYAENAAARGEWKEQLVQAKAMHELADIDKRVFEIRTLSDTTFAGPGASSSHGKVTCTVPFMGTSGIRMIAIGTNQGVWTGIEGDTNTIHLAIAISDVQQIAVLEDEYILLILADKTLYAYALDPLLAAQNTSPSSKNNSSTDKPYQKIAQHISFFHAGVCQGRTIVVAMKKRGVDSNFRVLEPVCGDLRNPQNARFLTKSGLFAKTPSWFKSALEFYIGTESYTVHFLKARIVVVCSRGFEIINLDALSQNRNLPDMTHPDFAFVQPDVRPLGMFKCRDSHYLLCYNAFAFMVDVHGSLATDASIIEWEGVPQSVAFYYPYVIGFDTRFVEIRHVETGELIQVLAGTHMRCLQFINHQIAPDIHGCMAHPFKPDYQYIFQLVGTFEPPLL